MPPLDLSREADLGLLADGVSEVTAATPPAAPPADADLLDAYSRAVIAAVGRVAPAVAHVRVERGSGPRGAREGAGSGFLITPDGVEKLSSYPDDFR